MKLKTYVKEKATTKEAEQLHEDMKSKELDNDDEEESFIRVNTSH